MISVNHHKVHGQVESSWLKKDGTKRFIIEYRHINDVTVKDAYPLPRIDESLDQLAGSKWFSFLELSAGYWQVEDEPGDKQKTAFTTRRG